MIFPFTELRRKLVDLVYDVTVGLVKDYKKSSVDLAKIELASSYIRLIRIIRQECLMSILLIFGAILFANVMLVFQMALLFYAPWPVAGKVFAAIFMGVVGFAVPSAAVLWFFSEKRWMAMTKADEFMAKAMDQNGS